MITISQLAKKFGISRTTILYYERAGLLLPTKRSSNNYRWYGEKEISRLEMIMAYRSFGLPVAQLPELLDRDDEATQEQILCNQFKALETEIQQLRLQQKAIMTLLKHPDLLENQMVTKKRWSGIMKAAGLSDQDMHNWHQQFEKMEPEAHQQFLESLNISPEEIKKIRSSTKKES